MQFFKKNFWTLSCLALVLVMALSGNALAADGNTLMETAQTKAKSVFSSVKTIIFIVGGFGLVLDDLMKIRGWNQLPAQLFARFGMGEIRQPFYDLIKLESLQSFLIHIKNPFYTGKV